MRIRRRFSFKRIRAEITVILVEPMGFESASFMETKEFCGEPWPSKVLKGKEKNS